MIILFKNTMETFKYFVIGLVTTIILLTFILFSIPIYLFRFLVINYLSKNNHLRPSNLRNPVSLFGNLTALEFWKNKNCQPSRCAIVTTFVVKGTVSSHELLQQIRNRWLSSKDPKTGKFLYPEFKQFIDTFFGFMFWYEDTQFNINDHVKIHKKLESNRKPYHSEKFLCKLMEHLLNKPFEFGKSPWEFHMIEKYEKEENTAFVLRIHHGLADGYSIIRCLLDGILEYEQLNILNKVISQSNPPTKYNRVSISNIVRIPYRFLCDFGYLGSLYLQNNSYWHVSDFKKQWFQLYYRSNFISISKLKTIKNKFGVSFTSVLLFSLSRALSKLEKEKRLRNVSSNLPFLFLLPVKHHSKSLTNDFTATVLDLPISSKLDSVSQLIEIEERLKNGKYSLIPLITRWILSPSALAQLAPIAKAVTHNYILPCGLTSMRTSDLGRLEWKGREILECDFAVGGALGVTGIAFMVQSYGNQIRVGVTAEKGLVTREDLNKFVVWVEQEILMLRDTQN